jgi:hypothetical protein
MKPIQLYYCDKKSSNTGRCSKVACYSALAVARGTKKEYLIHRCEEHKLTATNAKKVDVVSLVNFPQKEEHEEVNTFLRSFIGKPIFSSFHRNKYPITGKYLKDNGAIMCQDDRGKWYLIYYHQIKK